MRTLILLALAFIILATTGCEKEKIKEEDQLKPVIIDCNYFNSDRVLTHNPKKSIDYIVDCLVEIGNAKVTIEPGTVIVFRNGTGFKLSGNGYLKATGLSNSPITFKGEENTYKGSWRGLYFENSSPQNELTHCIIEGAGGEAFNSNNDRGAIVIWANSRLKLHNTQILNSGSNGINLSYSGSVIDLHSNVFKGNVLAPIQMTSEYIGILDKNSSYSDNGNNAISVTPTTIPNNTTIQKISIPYQINGVGFSYFLYPEGRLNIEPGVRVEFGLYTGIRIEPNSAIVAIGTVSDPIIFTSSDKVPGSWDGLYFNHSQSALNELNHVNIEYAGSVENNSAIYLWNDPVLRVLNTSFYNIAGCAFSSNKPNLTQQNNTFSNVSSGEFCE